MTSSCFSCHHATRTLPRWPPGPSSQAYLSLHSSEASQGIDISRPLFTCTNANQAATCTCNTQPRVSPHHVVNHSSQPGATIHRSSDPVLIVPFLAAEEGEWSECTIFLAEFEVVDEVRVLPLCGHAFHSAPRRTEGAATLIQVAVAHRGGVGGRAGMLGTRRRELLQKSMTGGAWQWLFANCSHLL
jgi:hypothetical protein